ncbi:hypothetical protein BpHYR1_035955 [Brachionus plicatilis]|uniref:Uncharacterized protein n=1 Tax=Brachionus plicatilis TaxID=10195 RepID=A0A3M7QPQ7_BRAPC|nr:hypothetical protein BpHYR1_035955 [Brachionus plicatilis]
MCNYDFLILTYKFAVKCYLNLRSKLHIIRQNLFYLSENLWEKIFTLFCFLRFINTSFQLTTCILFILLNSIENNVKLEKNENEVQKNRIDKIRLIKSLPWTN